RVDRMYLLHFLRSPIQVTEASNRATGINLPRLPPKELAATKVPLPPLAEQRRIAGILDAADALRRRRREALALLDTLPGAIFAEMFGGRCDVGTIAIADAVKNARTGPFGSQLLHSEFVDRGIPVLGIDN